VCVCVWTSFHHRLFQCLNETLSGSTVLSGAFESVKVRAMTGIQGIQLGQASMYI